MLWNPFYACPALIGPARFRRMCCCCVCILLVVFVAFFGPFIQLASGWVSTVADFIADILPGPAK
jgi:hypothetical protein